MLQISKHILNSSIAWLYTLALTFSEENLKSDALALNTMAALSVEQKPTLRRFTHLPLVEYSQRPHSSPTLENELIAAFT
ncbi:hypothetical protein DSUL_80063 [Desulfovibrionales bacterium]